MKVIGKAAVLLLTIPSVLATTMNTITIYSHSQCNGTPVRVYMTESSNCTNSECTKGEYNGGVQYRTTTCVESDRHEYVSEVFNGVSYVTLDHFGVDGCENLTFSSTYLAAGTCQSGTTNATVITKLYSNGSSSIQAFEGLYCGDMASQFVLDKGMISNHICFQDRYRFYSSTSEEAAGLSTASSSSSGNSSNSSESGENSLVSKESSGIDTVGIIGIATGSFALAVISIVVFLFIHRRRNGSQQHDELATPTGYTPTKGRHESLNSSTNQENSVPSSSQDRPSELTGTITGMWTDEVIVAARLPREKVFIKERISRGGYGEVYTGLFNDEVVAVKILLPETRKSISHVNEFLFEVKMMAMMEHPRITKFIGVAWDGVGVHGRWRFARATEQVSLRTALHRI